MYVKLLFGIDIADVPLLSELGKLVMGILHDQTIKDMEQHATYANSSLSYINVLIAGGMRALWYSLS